MNNKEANDHVSNVLKITIQHNCSFMPSEHSSLILISEDISLRHIQVVQFEGFVSPPPSSPHSLHNSRHAVQAQPLNMSFSHDWLKDGPTAGPNRTFLRFMMLKEKMSLILWLTKQKKKK